MGETVLVPGSADVVLHRNESRMRRHGVWRRHSLLGLLALVPLLGAFVSVLPALPAAAEPTRPGEQVFPVYELGERPPAPVLRQPKTDPVVPYQAPKVAWPAGATATVDLGAAAAQSVEEAGRGSGAPALGKSKARAGSLPVWVEPAQGTSASAGAVRRVRLTLAERSAAEAAGVRGLLVSAEAPDGAGAGQVQVSLGYGGIEGAFAADWAYRARLVRLPACAITTPAVPSCQVQTPVKTSADRRAKTLTTTVSLGRSSGGSAGLRADGTAAAAQPVVLAMAAAESGAAGDFTATSLAPSGSWSAGNNAGGFSYTYPIALPPVPAGSGPTVTLSYNSQSVDGKMVSTNSQASWIGDGWEYEPGYIEQTYVTCKDNPKGKAKDTSDSCWAGQIVHISAGAFSGDLIYDATQTKWKLSSDDGVKVEQVRTSGTNGVFEGMHWKVTAQDGTQYYFGRNKLPGWTSTKPVTNSAWTVPVYSPYSGDPCYSQPSRLCTMGWRWNLDYVVDVRKNATAYYYNAYTNYYGQNGATTGVPYIRSGVVDRAEYGLVDPTPYATTAPARVKFNVSERCIASGSACSAGNITSTPANWPDTPFADLNCNSGAVCNLHSPTFWSRLRLTSIETQIYNGSSHIPVDRYDLTHEFPTSDDGTSPSLWLKSIVHTGKVGADKAMPPVVFEGANKPNRVDTDDLSPAMNHRRITKITTESGGITGIAYTGEQCTAPVSLDPATNHSLCYPVYWTPDGATTEKRDWFHKYLVTQVDEQDPTGYAPTKSTFYEYLGDAAWHIDDNELTKAKYRTYGQWRGYPRVRTRIGAETGPRTLTESVYFLGMGGTVSLSADVPWPSGGPAATVTDLEDLSGRVRQTVTYLGDGGPAISSSVTDHWVGAATATRNRTGVANLTANFAREVATYSATAITSSGPTTWRTTKSETTYDTGSGLPTFILDRGDIDPAVYPAQATCTSITYTAPNTTLNLVNLQAEVELDAKPCGGSGVNGLSAPTGVSRPADVISHIRNYYNDHTFNETWPQAAPTNSNLTMVRQAKDYVGGQFQYVKVSRTVFDSYGRPISVTDPNGNNPTTTLYTQTNGLTTGVKVTNPAGHYTTTTLEPARGKATRSLDVNQLETNAAYDPLGRLTQVWLPGNATTNPANSVFVYDVSNTAVSSIKTRSLNDNGSYKESTALLDALMRPRQTQGVSPTGGRIVNDTMYDAHGWVVKQAVSHHDLNPVSTTLLDLRGQDNLMLNQAVTSYDGSGRAVLNESKKLGVTQWQVQTLYGGDRTTVLPPAGGTPTTEIVDARGRVFEKRFYTAAPAVVAGQPTGGTFKKITYGYDKRGKQSTVTDDAGTATTHNVWSSTYDMLGRLVGRVDPDAGSSTTSYDDNSNPVKTTDSAGQAISYKYDSLNRKTFIYDGPDHTYPVRAAWTYDSGAITNGLGQVASATSYDGAFPYTSSVGGYTKRYQPTSTTVSIADDPLNGGLRNTSYTFDNTYSPTNFLLTKVSYPGTTGALPAESVNYTYNTLDMPNGTGSLLGSYLTTTNYNKFGLVSSLTLGTGANTAYVTNSYNDHDLRLQGVTVDRTAAPTRVNEVIYRTKPTGMVAAIVDKRNDSAYTETQCFEHDLLGRLTGAWTATDDCASNVEVTGSNATVGGINPYWTSWTFNDRGDRQTQTEHQLPNGTGGDTVSTYHYPASGSSQPHRLNSVTAEGPNAKASSYTYDSTGNTATRTTADFGSQVFTWNRHGKVAKVDTGTGSAVSSYVHDVDGGLLVQRGPGTVTIYLPGQELTVNTGTGVKSGRRYYAGKGVGAVRTGTASTAYSYLLANKNGTATLSLDRTGQTPTWRPYTPYGADRTAVPASWPDTRGFLSVPTDKGTGLNLVGARQYDSATGRFVSLDPIFQPGDLNQLGGYAYAGNSPVTHSDPTGLCRDDPGTPCGDGHMHDGNGLDGKPLNNDRCSTMVCGPAGDLTHHEVSAAYQAMLARLEGVMRAQFVAQWQQRYYKYMATTNYSGWMTFADTGYLGNEAIRLREEWTLIQQVCFDIEGCRAANKQFLWDGYTKSMTLTPEDIAQGFVDQQGLGLARMLLGDAKVNQLKKNAQGACGCGCRSFSGDTEVLMADGTTKAIAAVVVGDLVMATDPETGETGARVVTATWVHGDELTDLEIDGRKLATTEDHPFWNVTDKEWQRADELDRGDGVLGAAGTLSRVGGLVLRSKRIASAYNLSVDHLNTYYVVAGDVSVLVHNTGPGWCGVHALEDGGNLIHQFDSPKGPIGVMADVSIDGSELILRNIAVYGEGISRGDLGVPGAALLLREVRTNLAPSLMQQGFTQVRIKGVRLTGPVGHEPDIVIKLS